MVSVRPSPAQTSPAQTSPAKTGAAKSPLAHADERLHEADHPSSPVARFGADQPLKLRVASARDTLGTATTFSCGSLLMTIELHDGYVPAFAQGTYFVQQQVAANRRCVQRAVDERGRARGDCVREVEEPITAQVPRNYRIRMMRKQ